MTRCVECGAYLDYPWEAHECQAEPPAPRKKREREEDSLPRSQVEEQRRRIQQAWKEWESA